MLIRRGFRYRIYLPPEQEVRLLAWEGALRALWNAAHEQRRLHLARGSRVPSAFDQIKLEATGGTLVEVTAAYSSQTCSACGLVDAASRDGERFRCGGCGHEAHADVNAAIVLLSRRTGGGAGRGGQGAVGPPMKRQLRVVRRGHSTVQGLGLLKSPGLQSE